MRQVLFSVCLLTVILLIGCNESNETTEPREEKITPVEVASIETGDFVVEKTVYGQTAAKKQVPVMLQEPGEISSIKIKNGDQVNKEDALATVKTPIGEQTIRATTNGTVARLQATEGSMQTNEEPLLLLVDTETLLIHYAVTANTRDLLKLDQTMNVYIEGEKYKATVTSVDTVPNETGQFAVELEMDNKEHDVLPGMPAKLLLADKKVKDTKIIPTEAVRTEGDEPFVFVVRNGHVEKVSVEVKETQSDQSAIEAELKKADQVVVNGHFTLTDQDKVEVIKEGK